ncbi:MCE family protein [Nocardioides antri]|uniref:MCE family protein n=1 Tax=Nocardioides antri TaxID=2607659 RepID=UPI00165F0C07|nr:MCE family protein [Nocardioides antri]
MSTRKLAAVLLASAALTGCGFDGVHSLPMPGAVDGDDTYPVTIRLEDATNLVPKESCRSHDTVVGSVESVTLDDDLKAVVVCRIRDDVKLPANVHGAIKETSLLGERYVALDPPPGVRRRGELPRGAEIPASRTRVDPNVELVLGTLSIVLNGGGLGQLETITRELNTALGQSELKGTFRELRRFVGTLDAHRSDITATLDGLDELVGHVSSQRDVIAEALDAVPGGLRALNDNRPELMRTLRRLDDLAAVAVPLIQQTRDDSTADLKHLSVVLSELTEAGSDIALSLERLALFPFPSQTGGILRGDYGGVYFSFVLDVDTLEELLTSTTERTDAPSTPTAPSGTDKTEPPPGGITLPPLPGLSPDGSGNDLNNLLGLPS